MIKGSFELMKQLNISVVLKAVMGNGALSRADIAKITGLTPATITNITKELMERGYLVQSRIGESSGGRPPIILELDPNARYIIGVSIGVGKIEVVISNIIAEILIKKSVDLENQDRNKDNVLSIIVNLVNEIIDESGIHKEKKMEQSAGSRRSRPVSACYFHSGVCRQQTVPYVCGKTGKLPCGDRDSGRCRNIRAAPGTDS